MLLTIIRVISFLMHELLLACHAFSDWTVIHQPCFADPTAGATESFVVADSCGLVRSNTGLSHTLQISVDQSTAGAKPKAAVTNSKVQSLVNLNSKSHEYIFHKISLAWCAFEL